MSKDLKLKALKVIEGLTMVYEDGRKTREDAQNILNSIYKYSHVAYGHCENPHKGWVDDLEKMEKSLKGYI